MPSIVAKKKSHSSSHTPNNPHRPKKKKRLEAKLLCLWLETGLGSPGLQGTKFGNHSLETLYGPFQT